MIEKATSQELPNQGGLEIAMERITILNNITHSSEALEEGLRIVGRSYKSRPKVVSQG